MRVNDLLKPHPEYNKELLDLYEVLYNGGHAFREALKLDAKGTLLGTRLMDADKFGQNNETYRDLRKAKAQYNSEASRIIANIISTAFKKLPRIVATGSGAEYYNSLNDDCDGSGTDFHVLLFCLLEGALLHKRGYLAPNFPASMAGGIDMKQAKESHLLDGKMMHYCARDVNFWACDGHGRLTMVRLYKFEDIRPEGWMPPTVRRHTWTFIDPTNVTTYQFDQPYVKGELRTISDSDEAAKVGDSVPHGYSRLPVIPLSFAKHFWVMDKIADGQLALFNSEADERFIRSQCAHPQQVISGVEGSVSGLYRSDVHALVLPPSATYQLVGPSSEQSTWHEDGIKRERASMYAALDAMKLYLASQPQNARQSADAKEMDSSSSTSLIAMFAQSLKDCAMQILRMIQEKRGDSATVTIVGLDDVDGLSLDGMIAEAQAFLALNPPPAAISHVVKKISRVVCADAPQEVLDEIEQSEAHVSEMPANDNQKPSRMDSQIEDGQDAGEVQD